MSIGTMLDNLKGKLIANRKEKIVEKDQTWHGLVRRAALGEEIDPAELEAVIDSSYESREPSCPKDRTHGLAVYEPGSDGSIGNWLCQNCGHRFQYVSVSTDVGLNSAERFAREVQVLKERIKSRQQIDEGPSHQEKLDKLLSQIDDAWQLKIKYEKAAKQLEQDLAAAKSEAEYGLRMVETAKGVLRRTFAELYPLQVAEIGKLVAMRKNVMDRLSEISDSAKNYNPANFNSVLTPSIVKTDGEKQDRCQEELRSIQSRLDAIYAQMLEP